MAASNPSAPSQGLLHIHGERINVDVVVGIDDFQREMIGSVKPRVRDVINVDPDNLRSAAGGLLGEANVADCADTRPLAELAVLRSGADLYNSALLSTVFSHVSIFVHQRSRA